MKTEWWEQAVIYEIYIRSFQDSNGDGIGDLRGILQRVDYLRDLGVDTLWITPFYPSPGIDFGYDITDHDNIDPIFGSLNDFDELVEACHRRDMKVVIDIVLNHTSDQHPFFLESKTSKRSSKRDWYIWKDPAPDGGPPNNWAGFMPSNWTFDPQTRQYYYHYFYPEQPDLNWRNPDVQKAMFRTLSFWMQRKVDGFRLDALNYLLEDEDLRDNPLLPEVPQYLSSITEYMKQMPIHTMGHPDNHSIYKKIRKHVKENLLLIGEVWVPDASSLLPYYGESHDEIDVPFNFACTQIKNLEAESIRKLIRSNQKDLGDYPTTTVFSNHDIQRATTRLAPDQNNDEVAKLLAILLFTLEGIPFVYYGEEIGMRDQDPRSIQDVQDPRGRRGWPKYKGRDGARRPMQWSGDFQAGFSTGTPWLALHDDYKKRNVDLQKEDKNSIWNFYKNLISLRKTHSDLQRGSIRVVTHNEKVLSYYRNRLLISLNLSPQHQTENPNDIDLEQSHLLLGTHRSAKENIKGQGLSLRPWEGIILRLP